MADSESEPESLPISPETDRAATVQARQILIFAIVLFILIDIIMVGMGPMFVRMEELSICRAYYYEHDPTLVDVNGNVQETLCKVDEVQIELALISGWLAFFETVPGKSFLEQPCISCTLTRLPSLASH
jgi:hypothetical protein